MYPRKGDIMTYDLEFNKYLKSTMRHGKTLEIETNWHNSFITSHIGSKKISSIKKEDIDYIVNNVLHTKVKSKYGKDTDRYYKESTVKKILSLISRVIEHAIDNDRAYRNPCKKVKIGKKRQNRKVLADKPDVVNSELQFNKLRTAIDGLTPYQKAFMLLCLYGRRTSEAIAIRWDDIDFENMQYKAYIKKVDKTQYFEIYGDLADVLHFLKDNDMNDKEYVFKKKNGKFMTTTSITRKLRLSSGLPYFTVHYCRNILASYMSSKGIDITTIGDMLTHKNLKTTELYTTRDIEKSNRIAKELLDAN